MLMNSIRVFFRHIRNGFRNLIRNGWMTAASVLTMTVTLVILGGLVLLGTNISNVTSDIEQGIQIRVHIDIAATPEDEAKLRTELEALPHVKQVTYRTKDEELADLVNKIEEFDLYGEDNNPLYNVFVVEVDSPDNLKTVTDQAKNLSYVINANYGDEDADQLLQFIETARLVLSFLAAVMIVVAVLLVTNTIRLTIFARQREIEIMRLVGAKNSYIRAPFLWEGTFIGIISAALAVVALYAIYEGIQELARSMIQIQVIQFTPIWPLLIYIADGLLIVGILLGIIGARRSIKRFLVI